MASSEERMRVLQMIQDGVISAEDGIRLLDSLDRTEKTTEPLPEAGGRTAKYFRVRVTDTKSGKTRVNVRLPVSVINAGVKMGARFSPQVEGLDMHELMQYIRSGMIGKIVDVYDDEDGEHVEVFLE
jgi:hypothetical protein